jgi:hypothetical protein
MKSIEQQFGEAKHRIKLLESQLKSAQYQRDVLRRAHLSTREILKMALPEVKDNGTNDYRDIHQFVRMTEEWEAL